MSELEIAMLGLGPSHPEIFADIFEETGEATVTAVWDQGDVRDDEYVEGFCEEYGAQRYDEPADIVGEVDGAMIESVNWDDHRRLAEPFLEAGMTTFVEKPIAGNLEDVEAIAAAAESGGANLFGGSGIPFHPNLEGFPTDVPGRTLFGSAYNDPFYYGVHIVDTLRYLVGDDWTSISPLDGPGRVVSVQFENDTNAALRLEEPEDDPAFAVLDVSDTTRADLLSMGEGLGEEMYARFIDKWIEAVRGEREETDRIIDGARLLLAVVAALGTEETITPDSEALDEVHEDGGAFLAEYQTRSRPSSN